MGIVSCMTMRQCELFTSLHFTLMISATYKFVYICTAIENYIHFLGVRTSKAATSKLEFTAN